MARGVCKAVAVPALPEMLPVAEPIFGVVNTGDSSQATVLLTPAISGMLSVAAPMVCAAKFKVTVCAAASAEIIFRPPDVLPLTWKKPVFVFPDESVIDGVVASVTVTAPLNWLAPVEVLNVPDPPEKSFAVAPDAV